MGNKKKKVQKQIQSNSIVSQSNIDYDKLAEAIVNAQHIIDKEKEEKLSNKEMCAYGVKFLNIIYYGFFVIASVSMVFLIAIVKYFFENLDKFSNADKTILTIMLFITILFLVLSICCAVFIKRLKNNIESFKDSFYVLALLSFFVTIGSFLVSLVSLLK